MRQKKNVLFQIQFVKIYKKPIGICLVRKIATYVQRISTSCPKQNNIYLLSRLHCSTVEFQLGHHTINDLIIVLLMTNQSREYVIKNIRFLYTTVQSFEKKIIKIHQKNLRTLGFKKLSGNLRTFKFKFILKKAKKTTFILWFEK